MGPLLIGGLARCCHPIVANSRRTLATAWSKNEGSILCFHLRPSILEWGVVKRTRAFARNTSAVPRRSPLNVAKGPSAAKRGNFLTVLDGCDPCVTISAGRRVSISFSRWPAQFMIILEGHFVSIMSVARRHFTAFVSAYWREKAAGSLSSTNSRRSK